MSSVPIMRKDKFMSWDTYYMSIALLSSFRSKDKNTSNGACITGSKNRIVGIGYNGLPRGLDDSKEQFWRDDDEDIENSRHTYVVHAEKNAIYNSMNHDLEGGTLYTTQYPCNVCAQAIIQVGIKRVVYLNKKENTDTHKKRNSSVKLMFKESGVKLECFRDLDVKDIAFLDDLEELNGKFYLKNLN